MAVNEDMIEWAWVGGLDPGVDWALVAQSLDDSGKMGLQTGAHINRLQAKTPKDAIKALNAVMLCCDYNPNPTQMILALEGAWLAPGCNRKQTLAYAKRVGWFEALFVLAGFHVAIIPPAFGKGGRAWKRDQGVAGLDGKERMAKAANEAWFEPANEHEADAFLICDWAKRRIHKSLLIGMKPPPCLEQAMKDLRKARNNAKRTK